MEDKLTQDIKSLLEQQPDLEEKLQEIYDKSSDYSVGDLAQKLDSALAFVDFSLKMSALVNLIVILSQSSRVSKEFLFECLNETWDHHGKQRD